MGGLAHFIEDEGVPTTQVSLIREHTEVIKPPRALWVPFPLGRPFGAPNDAAFQQRVLTATLELLEATEGPVLQDWTEEAPAAALDTHTQWACPVNFASSDEDLSETEALVAAFKREAQQLQPWYDRAVKERGRTTAVSSGIPVEDLPAFVAGFLGETLPENPRDDCQLGWTFKLAAEDLKAFYGEAVTAQPGEDAPTAEDIKDWFWGETTAANVLREIKTKAGDSDDRMFQVVGNMMLIPMDKAFG